MPDPPLRSCGFLLYREQPELSFLLMRHADRWDLPKGHVDPGETDLECALRELREETGILPEQVEIDPVFRFETAYTVRTSRTGGKPREKTLLIYLGKLLVTDLAIQVTEHQAYEWFRWAPPHRIQVQTIDPLLAELESHWGGTMSELDKPDDE